MAVLVDLPVHILDVIAQYLIVLEDFASFISLSKECQFVTAMLKKKPSLPPRYPRLMLAENKDVPVRGFVNLLTSKTFGVNLPEAYGRTCIGAQYGWLLTVGFDLQINLLHPFSRQQICLPPMLTLPEQYDYDEDFPPQRVVHIFVRKIAMSASPLKGNNLNNECVVVAIYGEVAILAFARLGDTVWTNIQVSSRCYEDVIYYKRKFYVIDCHGVLFVCDIEGNDSPKATLVGAPAPSTCDMDQKYLVESSGHLLLVARVRDWKEFVSEYRYLDDEGNINEFPYKEDEAAYYTIGFHIWKLVESHEEGKNCAYEWAELTTLGDQALFLGNNVSTSVTSSRCIKANCIYFTDDYVEGYSSEPGGGGEDTGIFNIENGTIQLDYAGESRSKLSPPLWYM